MDCRGVTSAADAFLTNCLVGATSIFLLACYSLYYTGGVGFETTLDFSNV